MDTLSISFTDFAFWAIFLWFVLTGTAAYVILIWLFWHWTD